MDLRAELEAAMTEAGDEGSSQPVEQSAPIAAATETNEQQTADEAHGAQARDEVGKFAKAQEGQDSNAGKSAGEEPPEGETIRTPASLPAALKAKFRDLPQEWRDAFLKREEDVNGAKAQWDAKANQYNRFEELISPRRERFKLSGLDEFQAIQSLFAAQDLLERNPVEGLQYLARSYGVNLHALAAQAVGQGHAQPAHNALLQDPQLAPLVQTVQTLQQQIARQQEEAAQAQLATSQAEIANFASDPKHLYFDNVRPQMIALLQSGQAKSLADAYEQACWMSPEVRPVLLQEQTAKQQASANQLAERERAAAAKRAAGSVTGGPGVAQAPQSAASKGSIRDDLKAALEEHA